MKRRERREPITAAELMAKLEADPAWVERRRQQDEEQRRHIAEYDALASPLLEQLREAGFEVESVSDLFNENLDYKRVVPLLLAWLPRVDARVKEGIVRALSVSWARPTAAPLLVKEFERAEGQTSGLRWAIANALSVVADDTVLPDLLRLVAERRYGRDREMLALALGNMQDARAVSALIGLLDDEDIAGHAVMALGQLRARAAVPAIERFLTHPKPWIRREAKKALKRIGEGGREPSQRDG